MATTQTQVASLTTHLTSHIQSLNSIYSQLSESPVPLLQQNIDDLTNLIHQTTSAQLSTTSHLLSETKDKLEKEWKKVDGWKNALGEPNSTRRSFGQSGLEPLLVQLDQVEQILKSMRGRMEERGTIIVNLQRKLIGDVVPVLGRHFVKLELEDLSEDWEGLDLRLERMSSLEREVVRCEAEIATRKQTIAINTNEIFALRSELGIHSSAEGEISATDDPFDELILCHLGVGDSREKRELLPTEENVKRLEAKRVWLEEEKMTRNNTIQTTYDKLYPLWAMLGVSDQEMEDFVNRWMGSTMDVVNAYQTELTRMLTLKRSNLSSFILAERALITQLWDALYLSPQQRLASFAPFTIDVTPLRQFNPSLGYEEEFVNDNVSEELLVAHERERERLEAVREGMGAVLERLEKYFEVIREMAELEASASDPSRLLGKSTRGDPGRLLREEKARKRVAKDKPKLELELRSFIPQWEQANNRPFLVNGKRFLDELDEKIEREQAEKDSKKRSKTPSSSSTSRTAPLRSQPTGSSSSAAPLKRQMTGGASKVGAPAGKRQAPMHTGGGGAVLGEVGNRVLSSQQTGGAAGASGFKLQSQQTGGMKLPPGWATTAPPGAGGNGLQQQYGGQPVAGFRPRSSVTSSVGGSSGIGSANGSAMTGMGWSGGH